LSRCGWGDDASGAAAPPQWSRGDSNPGPPPCKGGALPAKLRPPDRLPAARPPEGVGAPGLEPGTSALSGPRSNHLSYAPAAPRTRPVVPSGGQDPGLPRRTRRPMPKTERADQPLAHDLGEIARPGRTDWPNNASSVRDARGAADLPAIRGAPARSYHRLATGRPRGSVPTNAGSPLGSLTRVSGAVSRSDDLVGARYSLERR
jgi:hypothetical protein